jgi:hypothetical protein
MAKQKYKIGQMVDSADIFGRVTEIHLKEPSEESASGVTYKLDGGEEVAEEKITAVYKAVAPRKPKAPKADKPAKAGKDKK